MAICPFATQRLLPENASAPRLDPRGVVVHTAVDSAADNSSIHGYFSRADVLDESHFYVKRGGEIEQYMDTNRQADAQGRGNPYFVSVETEDNGRPEQLTWTAAQIASMVKLIRWLRKVHPKIPARRMDRWDGSGIGWHSMWGMNTRANMSINPWTKAVGKTCPGPLRIAQMPSVIAAVGAGEPPPPPKEEEEEDMAFGMLIDREIRPTLKDGELALADDGKPVEVRTEFAFPAVGASASVLSGWVHMHSGWEPAGPVRLFFIGRGPGQYLGHVDVVVPQDDHVDVRLPEGCASLSISSRAPKPFAASVELLSWKV